MRQSGTEEAEEAGTQGHSPPGETPSCTWKVPPVASLGNLAEISSCPVFPAGEGELSPEVSSTLSGGSEPSHTVGAMEAVKARVPVFAMSPWCKSSSLRQK